MHGERAGFNNPTWDQRFLDLFERDPEQLAEMTIAEYAELGNFGVRVTMSYQPNTLAQQFTVDVLYGAAVLRNSFGVQVSS